MHDIVLEIIIMILIDNLVATIVRLAFITGLINEKFNF